MANTFTQIYIHIVFAVQGRLANAPGGLTPFIDSQADNGYLCPIFDRE